MIFLLLVLKTMWELYLRYKIDAKKICDNHGVFCFMQAIAIHGILPLHVIERFLPPSSDNEMMFHNYEGHYIIYNIICQYLGSYKILG